MRETMALMRVTLLGLLTSFSGSRGGKKKVSAPLVVGLMALLSVYISGLYSYLLATSLAPAGLLELLPVLMAVMGCVMSLLFTSMGAGGIVFGGKDMDLMLSLPVSAFSVMLSKLLALYAENLLFNVFLLAPAGVVYALFGGAVTPVFLVTLVLSVLFLSFLSTLLAAVVGFFLALLQSRSEGKALLTNLAYLVFLILVFAAAFQINGVVGDIAAHQGAVEGALATWLLPFGLFQLALGGNAGALLGFLAITLIPFLLVVLVFSRFYKSILSKLAAHKSRSDYRLGELAAGNAFSALFRKEAGRFFGTPIYLFNMGIGVIMAVGGSVFACFQKEMLGSLLAAMPQMEPVLLLAAALSFLLLMTDLTCVSISLEGKYLWILKEAPINSKTLFSAKALLNVLLLWGTGIVCAPLLWYAFSLSVPAALALLCLCLCLGVFVPSYGLAVNLLFPKMDAVSDTLVVKQSLSTMIGIFSGMVLVALAGLSYWGLFRGVGAVPFLLGVSALLLAAGLLLWVWVLRKGPAILKRL